MLTIPIAHMARSTLLLAVLIAIPAVLTSTTTTGSAQECRVPSGDFCVCCPPSDCRKEAAFCPGGTGGLLVLKARHPACAVNPFAAARCKSGGVIASEQRSALGVYTQGQRARIELSQEQLDALVGQLETLRP
jgi:hypothetical protein